MSTEQVEDAPISGRRGALGILVLVIPIVSIVVVGLAYVVMIGVGSSGRPAEGDRVRLTFTGCADSRAVIARRVDRMGLAEPVFTDVADGYTLDVTMPEDPRAAGTIPPTLVAKGDLKVVEGEEGAVIAARDDIADVSTSMQFLDAPRTWIKLTPAASERLKAYMGANLAGHISVWVDGERVSRRKNAPPVEDGQLDVVPEGIKDDRAAVEFAAALGVILSSGPLPCSVSVHEGPVPAP